MRTSDVISLHCPLTPETHHLIDTRALSLMKPSAYLVNVARGPVVDEVALAKALRERRIAGAGLDVFEDEPTVHADLLDLENVAAAAAHRQRDRRDADGDGPARRRQLPGRAAGPPSADAGARAHGPADLLVMLPRDPRVKPTREQVDAIMKRIGNGIRALGMPAIEKISEEQSGTAFHVLIATMLSAQTRDPVTLEASTRLFAKAPTPEVMAKLSEAQIEKLIYPVSFYRNKAAHVKATCRKLLAEFGGVVPSTMERAPDAARRRPQDRQPGTHRRAPPAGQHLRGHARPSHRQPLRLGAHADARADRARALRGDGEEVVGADQPVPR